jgi:hypothetical protein
MTLSFDFRSLPDDYDGIVRFFSVCFFTRRFSYRHLFLSVSNNISIAIVLITDGGGI